MRLVILGYKITASKLLQSYYCSAACVDSFDAHAARSHWNAVALKHQSDHTNVFVMLHDRVREQLEHLYVATVLTICIVHGTSRVICLFGCTHMWI